MATSSRQCHGSGVSWKLILLLVLTGAVRPSATPSVPAQAGQLDPTFGTGGLVTTSFPSGSAVGDAVALQPDGKIVAVGWTPQSTDPFELRRDFAIARYNPDGSLDSTFGIDGRAVMDISGRDDAAHAVALTPEGKIIVAGESIEFGTESLPFGTSYYVIARYSPDGSLDPSFGAGGVAITDPAAVVAGGLLGEFSGLVLQPDGKIVAAGLVAGFVTELMCPPVTSQIINYNFAILRYQEDGALDHGFGAGGIVVSDYAGGLDEIADVVLDATGRIIVGGSVAGGPPACGSLEPRYFALARYGPDGTPDAMFGGGFVIPGPVGRAHAVVLQSDDRIVAAGGFVIGATSRAVLVRYDSSGFPDHTFGSAGMSVDSEFMFEIKDVMLQPNGMIVGIGEAQDPTEDRHFGVARYDTSGMPDPGFGTSGHVITPFPATEDSEPTQVVRQANGRIVVVGVTEGMFALARYLGDGSGNIIFNGSFTPDASGWLFFATPNLSYIVANVVNGVLEFYRVPPPAGTTNQAVAFQLTGIPVPADAFVWAEFKLGNSSTVRKRISVLVHDSDFSDLSVCTFWLAPHAPLRAYRMRTMTTEPWVNATVSFYAATAGSDGGAYLVDDVFVEYVPGASLGATECLDPTAPAPAGGGPGPTLVTNGDFASPGLAPWTPFGTLTYQVAGGVFEFVRPSSTPPAGVVLQATGHSMTAGEILTATFELGNSSAVRKRATVLLHDLDFSDLSACTFWLEPGQLLMPYVMRTFTTEPWANATVSIYAATVGPEPWTRLDNVTFRRTPSLAVTGTVCIGPGGAVQTPAGLKTRGSKAITRRR